MVKTETHAGSLPVVDTEEFQIVAAKNRNCLNSHHIDYSKIQIDTITITIFSPTVLLRVLLN